MIPNAWCVRKNGIHLVTLCPFEDCDAGVHWHGSGSYDPKIKPSLGHRVAHCANSNEDYSLKIITKQMLKQMGLKKV